MRRFMLVLVLGLTGCAGLGARLDAAAGRSRPADRAAIGAAGAAAVVVPPAFGL